MAGQTIDYDALAKQHGAISSGLDYDALAKQHGAVSSTPPAAKANTGATDAGFLPTLGHDFMDAPRRFLDFVTGHPVEETLQTLRDLTTARKEHQSRAMD